MSKITKKQEKLFSNSLTKTAKAIKEIGKLGNINGTRSGKSKEEDSNLLTLRFGPVAHSFIYDHNFTSCLLGPVGSGKTVAMFVKMLFYGLSIMPGKDGIRYSSHVVIRDTKPALKNTTIKTFKDWFKRFDMTYKESTDEAIVKINDAVMHFKFLGIETAEDVDKLLSLEATIIYFNELSTIHPKVWNYAQQRIGRYPSIEATGSKCWFDLEKCLEYGIEINEELMEYETLYIEEEVIERGQITTKMVEKQIPRYQCHCVIADTNAPREDSWYKKLFEKELFNEKTGIDENPATFRLYKQPSGLSKFAENIDNLPKGYYQMMKKSQPKEYVDQQVRVMYGIGEQGMPVFGRFYNKERHVIDDCKEKHLNNKKKLIIGMDFGLNPCAIIGQYYDDVLYVFHELYTRDRDKMSLDEFLKYKLNDFIMTNYPDYYKHKENIMFCIDPAGKGRDTNFGWNSLRVIQEHGYKIVTVDSSNRYDERLKAVKEMFAYRKNGIITYDSTGRQRIYIDSKCHWLLSGLRGNYYYENVKKGDTISEKPCKNEYSHLQDAFQYQCTRILIKGDKELSIDFNDFNVYNDFNDGVYDQKIGY